MEIKMKIQTTKDLIIQTPDNMTQQVAQQCFLIGLKNLIYLNNGNVLMSYFQDGKIKTTALNGQSGQIMIKFLKSVQQTEKFANLQDQVQNGQTKKQYLERNGSQLLQTLSKHIKDRNNKK